MGQPWTPEFDCWQLVRDAYRYELDIDLPFIGIAPETLFASLRKIRSHPVRSMFRKVETPAHMNVAEFSSPGAAPFHIGLYVETPDGPMILHNPFSGVVLERLPQIESDIKFWNYHG